MSDVALLNPALELNASRVMLEHAKVQLQKHEQTLLHRELAPEDYLKTFGAVTALRVTVEAMEAEYRRMTLK